MKLIRKLIVGISTICLLVMTFVSATYAWFEINSRAMIDNFHFEVHGGQGFLVSIDNVNYTNDLKLIQLQKAMLVAYGGGDYRLATDGTETLYQVTYEDAYDAEGHYSPKEKLVPVEDNNIPNIINGKNGIQLLPTTSQNGRELMDLYNSVSNVSSGRFVQFDIYFKATSNRAEDNYSYKIYLNGEEGKNDDGAVVEPTSITSEITHVTLNSEMVAMIPGAGVKKATRRSKSSGDIIDVYSSNAMRLSITDQEYYEEYQKDENGNVELDENGNKKIIASGYRLVGDNPTKIYELNDTVNKNTDLGSYATDYNGGYSNDELEAMISSTGTVIAEEELALYCSNFNAMYTYYNNLKPDAKLTDRLLKYEDVKNMNVIRNLSGHDSITTVKSGDKPKLLTFRLWLEGWDADCFDGIKYAVKVKLAFGSKRVYE